jgi:hypothetical protein
MFDIRSALLLTVVSVVSLIAVIGCGDSSASAAPAEDGRDCGSNGDAYCLSGHCDGGVCCAAGATDCCNAPQRLSRAKPPAVKIPPSAVPILGSTASTA